ncbi:MAG: DUF3817 domain-containing protein [Luteibaculaceae bacterium]
MEKATALLKDNFGRFRIIAFFEGVSYLALFFVSMPLKYIWEIGGPNKVIGMAHGFFFIAYVILLYVVQDDRNWSKKKTFLAFLASLLPFGTFWAEAKLYHKD